MLNDNGQGNMIVMRVWVEQMKHSDGSFTYSLNYDVSALDSTFTFFGSSFWAPASKLHNITYTLNYSTFCGIGEGGTKSGTINLIGQTRSTSILFDGSSGTIKSVLVTGQRYGGAHGITVQFKH